VFDSNTDVCPYWNPNMVPFSPHVFFQGVCIFPERAFLSESTIDYRGSKAEYSVLSR
jgi:hypothetical protein